VESYVNENLFYFSSFLGIWMPSLEHNFGEPVCIKV
jgi:hypothetical protein